MKNCVMLLHNDSCLSMKNICTYEKMFFFVAVDSASMAIGAE